jgi:hypothetical protein
MDKHRNSTVAVVPFSHHLFVDLYSGSFLASYHPGARSATTSTRSGLLISATDMGWGTTEFDAGKL